MRKVATDVLTLCLATAVIGNRNLPGQQTVRDPRLVKLEASLEKKFTGIKSISATFTQEKEMVIFEETMILQGSLFLHRSGRLAWRVNEPVRYVLVISDKALQQWDEDSDQVLKIPLTKNPALKAMVQQLRLWFAGKYDQLNREYDVTLVSEGPYVLRFVPQEKSMAGKFIKQVNVTLSGDDLYARKIVIQETGGDRVTMRLGNVVLNAPVTRDTWKVKPRD